MLNNAAEPSSPPDDSFMIEDTTEGDEDDEDDEEGRELDRLDAKLTGEDKEPSRPSRPSQASHPKKPDSQPKSSSGSTGEADKAKPAGDAEEGDAVAGEDDGSNSKRKRQPSELNGNRGLTELIQTITSGTANLLEDDNTNSPLGRPYIGPSAGCTAVTAHVHNGVIHVANAGDSRAVLSRGGEAIPLSHDHKPNDELEGARIRLAGGFVQDNRVNGNLNLSRAIGDMEYKQAKDEQQNLLPPERQQVSVVPDVKTMPVDPEMEFIILACDGIWDVMSN